MKIRNKVKVIMLCFMLFITLSASINAANINGNSNVNVGETFTITFVFGTNVGAYDSINVSYDTNMYEYVSGDSLNESVWWDQTDSSNGISSKSYTFRALRDGTSRITVVAKGVTSANESMDSLGTLTAEKVITATSYQPEPPQVEEPPQEDNPPPVTNNNVALNSNNFLKYLQISEEGLNPFFTRNVTEYSLVVGENVSSIDVLARAEDSNARVQITGNDNIVDGNNVIQIRVTAQNGNVRTYRITVTKTNNKETANAYLENLIVEDYNLDKDFQSEVLEYYIGKIPNTITVLNVVAIPKTEKANIEILGADRLTEKGMIIVKVIAEDGKTTREYKIKYDYVEASDEDIYKAEIKDYLKEIQGTKSKKEKAILYLKYLWLAIKKNYLLVAMYALILLEFIQIVVLRKRMKKENDDGDNGDGGDDNTPGGGPDKEILKVEVKEEEKELPKVQTFEPQKIEPPQITPLKDEPAVEPLPLSRHGSLQNKAEGIKLVDLDHEEEGPQDELTFNIFENLNDEDIKRMLEDQINND